MKKQDQFENATTKLLNTGSNKADKLPSCKKQTKMRSTSTTNATQKQPKARKHKRTWPKKRSHSFLRRLQDVMFFSGLALWLLLQVSSPWYQNPNSAAGNNSASYHHVTLDAKTMLDAVMGMWSGIIFTTPKSQEQITQDAWKRALALQQQEYDEGGNDAAAAVALSSFMLSPMSRNLRQYSYSSRSTMSHHLVNNKNTEHVFSACLIVKDDNHWLSEWLAYHYHVMPLRHLVIVNDPTSRTSPRDILNRWEDYMHRRPMQIDVWTDSDFLPLWVLQKAAAMNNNNTSSSSSSNSGLWLHLNRQKHFYGKCLQHLQKQGRTWVLLTDTDEFVRVNPVRQPLDAATRARTGHIVRFLESALAPMSSSPTTTSICLLAPRLQMAAVESEPGSKCHASVPPILSSLNVSDLLTYRWLYHNGQELPAGKNIIKLHPQDTALPRVANSVHHILESCPRNTPGESGTENSLLVISHYLGSLEQFTFRDDPRDAVDNRPMQWHSRGQFPPPVICDKGLTAWLHGFVRLEGLQTAQNLLDGVGKLPVEHTWQRRPTQHNQDHYNTTLIQEHLQRMKQGYESAEPFAACLVTMDDNHWLIEWLAYHYHVLPLRKLVYVQDPHSRTDSKPIFDRWKGKMDIEQWQDDQFIPPHIFQRPNLTNSAIHRYRQKFFFASCLRFLKSITEATSPRWVLLADVDEFVRPNTLMNGHVNAKLPTLRKPGCISRFLQAQLRAHRVVSGSEGNSDRHACLYVPRIQITCREYYNETNTTATGPVIEKYAPPIAPPHGFDRNKFLTFRWFFHNGKEIVVGDNNLDGKNILDLNQLDVSEIPKQIRNVHHVLPDYCPGSNGGQRLYERESWLAINHYLGTFEQYTFRHDPRDVDIPGRPQRLNLSYYESLGQPATVLDTVTTSWLAGFVESVGLSEAHRLLQDVGETHPSQRSHILSKHRDRLAATTRHLAKRLGILAN